MTRNLGDLIAGPSMTRIGRFDTTLVLAAAAINITAVILTGPGWTTTLTFVLLLAAQAVVTRIESRASADRVSDAYAAHGLGTYKRLGRYMSVIRPPQLDVPQSRAGVAGTSRASAAESGSGSTR